MAEHSMPTDRLLNYQEWLLKAQDDELNALSLLKHRDGTASVELGTILESVLTEEIQTLNEDLNYLTQFYVESRYPGDYPEYTWDEAKKALDAVVRVKEFVLAKLK